MLYVHELKHLLEDAKPDLDADNQDRILFQQLLAGSPTTAIARFKDRSPVTARRRDTIAADLVILLVSVDSSRRKSVSGWLQGL